MLCELTEPLCVGMCTLQLVGTTQSLKRLQNCQQQLTRKLNLALITIALHIIILIHCH